MVFMCVLQKNVDGPPASAALSSPSARVLTTLGDSSAGILEKENVILEVMSENYLADHLSQNIW